MTVRSPTERVSGQPSGDTDHARSLGDRCRRIGLPPCCLLFARALIADPEAFQRDRVKQNELALMGYQVLRFTWLDLTEYTERVIAEIEFALSRRAGDAASSRTGAAH